MFVSTRTTNILLVLLLAVGIGIVAMLASGVRGGPLDPPGSPAPTDSVREVGTPISTLPFTISAPGLYYLTRDLSGVADASGVTISASDVTLDLHGFAMTGVSTSIDGVLVNGARTNVRVVNGTIRDWYNGIDAQTATHSSLSRISVLASGDIFYDGSAGVLLGGRSVIEDCNVSNNAAIGILSFGATIRRCIVAGNGTDGIYAKIGSVIVEGDARANHTSGNSYDVRVMGSDVVKDSYIGLLGIDATNEPSFNVIERNVFCFDSVFGNQPRFDLIPMWPDTDGNVSIGSCP